jgi:hypothetical protein
MGFSIRQKPLSAAYDLHQRATDYQEFNTGVLHLLHEGRLIWCQARPPRFRALSIVAVLRRLFLHARQF